MKNYHIFYACDGRFLNYAAVSFASLARNATPKFRYTVHFLSADLPSDARERIVNPDPSRFTVVWEDVSAYLSAVGEQLPIRDYYTGATYFRLFIAGMHPEIDKAVYLDCDTVVTGDVSELFALRLGDAFVGAATEQVMVQNEVFGRYAEEVVGVPRDRFFNAGVLVINCARFRKERVAERFSELLGKTRFALTQDEDYLNVLCRGRVCDLDPAWNFQTFGEPVCREEDARLIHYVMAEKPWHSPECRYGEKFWEAACGTAVFDALRREAETYPEAEKENDRTALERLERLALSEIGRDDRFAANGFPGVSPDRMRILAKIREYERDGRFDEDVEDDPPAPVLLPDQIDYLHKGLSDRLGTCAAKITARVFLWNLLRKKQLIVKEIRGIENFRSLASGAVITCNHFNALDSFAMQMAYDAGGQKKRRLYRVIREGNYTNFPGFYGFLMRHYDTLPLSSDHRTVGKLLSACGEILRRGDLILIYPEQAMWWNYRKPRPLKPGAFSIAAKNGVPVLPCFITMKNSGILGADGFFVQEYTIHICPPIYPDAGKRTRENVSAMMAQNEKEWQDVYRENV